MAGLKMADNMLKLNLDIIYGGSVLIQVFMCQDRTLTAILVISGNI